MANKYGKIKWWSETMPQPSVAQPTPEPTEPIAEEQTQGYPQQGAVQPTQAYPQQAYPQQSYSQPTQGGYAQQGMQGGYPQQQATYAQNNGQPTLAQPLVVVPYSTPMQPLVHYPDGTVPIGDFYSDGMSYNGMPAQGYGPMPGYGQPDPNGPHQPIPEPDDILESTDSKKKEKYTDNSDNSKSVNGKAIFLMLLAAAVGGILGYMIFGAKNMIYTARLCEAIPQPYLDWVEYAVYGFIGLSGLNLLLSGLSINSAKTFGASKVFWGIEMFMVVAFTVLYFLIKSTPAIVLIVAAAISFVGFIVSLIGK